VNETPKGSTKRSRVSVHGGASGRILPDR